LELRSQLRRLQWYGEVNRRGFVKITKKLEKKVPGVLYQQSYLASKVDPKPFATNQTLSEDMKKVNDWLSSLGDIRIPDDSSSVKSGNSMRIVSARSILNLPPGLLENVEQAVRNDDAVILDELLLETDTGTESVDIKSAPFQRLLHNLLQRAISTRSKRCIKSLLSQLDSLVDEEDLDERNCIHRLMISIGRSKYSKHKSKENSSSISEGRQFLTPAALPMRPTLARSKSEADKSTTSPASDDSIGLLLFLLENLSPNQQKNLDAKDSYGRLPLHYAAEYGSIRACEIIIRFTKAWNPIHLRDGIHTSFWEDLEGLTPLHLGVINGHFSISKILVGCDILDEVDLDAPKLIRKHCSTKSTSVLNLATESNQFEILRLLVLAGFDINQQDSQGEVPLHLAARFGHVESTRVLLDRDLGQSPRIDVPEKAFAWTPLFVASVDGNLPVVKLLIAAGADTERLDSSGWTAKEHAALRGHLDIAQCLITEPNTAGSDTTDLSTSPKSTSPISGSLEERKSGFHHEIQPMKTVKPVKTFGHRYLTKESMILVSLGSMDSRKQVDPVKLDAIPLADAHSTQLDTALSLVISASGASGESEIVDLPSQENLSTEPFYFMTSDVSKVKLRFDIVPTYAGTSTQIIGRGVALLASMKASVGSKRMNLQGDVSVPILAASTLEPIGVVNFNFMVITPFEHPNMFISEDHTYWRKTAPVVIGHRGLGKNFGAGRRSLQLGENTIQSFIAAANLGASYVEFDVQLTKDHVPVIYHDFLVSETGIDAPVHTLTLEQFLHVSESHSGQHSRSTSPRGNKSESNAENSDQPRIRQRAMSVGNSDGDRTHLSALDRMKHTRDVKAKGWKANMYGNVIKQPFTTLAEMFQKLPESIGFNIEMKYPMLFESEEQDMDTYAVELNSFVDTVLQLVYDKMGERHVIFSSFHPDICLLLNFKQPSIPVLFLTDAGSCPVGDIRASSLQEAIRFTSRWNMLGVVSAAEPFVMCPRLVRVVKESGLVCVSYGMLNNQPENVKVSHNFSRFRYAIIC
jgi:glycerophosphodiester phosphodiesterase